MLCVRALAALAVVSCGEKEEEERPSDTADTAAPAETGAPEDTAEPDADGDGWPDEADCDDADSGINPGSAEVWYDGVDGDCDGGDDYDQDADGHAHAEHGGDDCDDADAGVNPGAEEVWYDGVDQN